MIGLTGNIACGKTSVGNMLLALGAERYIDADAIVHHLYESGQPIAIKVAQSFGPSVMAADGSVDRNALGAVVFQDAEAMQRLEHIVHPAVGVALMEAFSTVSSSGVVVIDAVKLLEGNLKNLCQTRWLVVCPEEQERARLMTRNQLSRNEADVRLRAQPSRTNALALVDEVIDNGGSLDETYSQVKAAFDRFCKEFPA